MRKASRRTAYRIAGSAALAFAALSLLLGAVTWTFVHRTLRHILDDRLRGELSTLLQAGAREGRAALIADIEARDAGPGGGSLLFDPSGRRIVGGPDVARPAVGLSNVVLPAADGAVPGRAAAARIASGETLAVVGEAASLARIEATLLAISGAGFGLMLAIGVGGGFLIGHMIHRRLHAVDAAARAIIDGDLARRMPIGRHDDEFDRLAATLNRMLDRIGLLMDSLRHVSDDVAHDLRTPLARLRAVVEAALDSPDEGVRRAGLAEALSRVDGVMTLFATILRISEVERGRARRHFAPVRLDALAAGLIEDYAPAIADGGRTISSEIEEDVVVSGDEALIGQATVNLIENALKHTPCGTRIFVSVVAGADGGAVLTVADDGAGIPPEDRPLVLRRFVRRDASRTTAGYGLGLTLVAAIAAAHRVTLRLEDARPGLAVTLAFPPQG